MKPRLLDLFCGAGGAARGYQLAGFHVTGVDNKMQPNYIGDDFRIADALWFARNYGHEFDAVHASPPCQKFSSLTYLTGNMDKHLNLIPATRRTLSGLGVPYVIENVPGAPLLDPYLLCGPALGLEIIRHRIFETTFQLADTGCGHVHGGTTTGAYIAFYHSRRTPPGRSLPPRRTEGEYRRAMGTEWMTLKESRQAVPPRYAEHIGKQLMSWLR